MERFICIHGHFYQPPRENPWLEEVEVQDSASPYHDWNQRITAECYAPNATARRLNDHGNIVDIYNNYSRISFNFGPTLLSWMERNEPKAYQSILLADAMSCKHFSGHGSAIAQGYNHMILPLANSRDKETQVVWGIRDFEHRFKRPPKGMWLPETAVDYETLDLMSQQGIKFTILAPRQAKAVRPMGTTEWQDVSGDRVYIKRPYLCRLPSGRTITLFFYDGPTSRDAAFGDLLSSGENLANRLFDLFDESQDNELVHIATDGETFGHHHRMGDMALAACLSRMEADNRVKITNYGEYLEKFPPAYEAQIFENSSWSCVHGVERWKDNCGCCAGRHPGAHQLWRKPLRNALDWIRDTVSDVYERELSEKFNDPWAARNNYIDVVLDRSVDTVDKYLVEQGKKSFSQEEKIKLLKLLEMQRNAMLMFTSCGWFFDEISCVETKQILHYAARTLQLAFDINSVPLETAFINLLEQAPSNLPEYNNGAEVYRKDIRPSVLDLVRVGAHYAVSSVFEHYSDITRIYSYQVDNLFNQRIDHAGHALAIGKARIFSEITWEESVISYSVFHLGDHNLTGGVREHVNDKMFGRMQQEIQDIFRRNDAPGTIRMIEKHFDTGHYSLKHLFKDEQTKVLYQILDANLEEVEMSLRQINENHYPIIHVIKQLGIPLPKVIQNTVLVMINADLLRVLSQERIDFDRLEKMITDAQEWSLEIDKITISHVVKRRVNELMEKFIKQPRKIILLETMERLLRCLAPLKLSLDLSQAQNIYFFIAKRIYPKMKKKEAKNRARVKKWVSLFRSLGHYLAVEVF